MKNYVVKFTSTDAQTYKIEGAPRITHWVLTEVSERGIIIQTGDTLDEFFAQIIPMCARFTVIDLNFYGHFLLYWLYGHGYTFNRALSASRTFDVWLNDAGIWYSLRTVHKRKNKKRDYAEFVDAKHKLIVSAHELPAAFGLSINTDTPELEAIATAQALYKLNRAGMRGITLSADCLHDYLATIGEKSFKTNFPELDDTVTEFVQQAYTGGYNYINPKYLNKPVRASSYDVTSMYSDVMLRESLPCGDALKYSGAPPQNGMLFVHEFSASFSLKPGMLPTLKLRDRLDVGTDYLFESAEPLDMVLTSVDFALFLEHYNVTDIQHVGGYAFRHRAGLFNEYVQHWFSVKLYTTDPAQRTIAKHHLNHLYGVFGRSKTRKCKTPIYTDGSVSWHSGLIRGRTGYMPLAAFVTAYARKRIIDAGQLNYDRFICACTDSIKLEYAPNTPHGIRISKDIGDYKCEYDGAPFKILKTNTYAYVVDSQLNIVASGMTAEARQQITDISQFTYNLRVKNVLTVPVRGGAIKIQQDLILST